MEQLVFQLQAPLSSWGEPAVGEYRGTSDVPSQSALIGLLGSALGLEREDEAAHAALRDGYGWAVAQLDGGSLLRDYQTAQVPPRSALKGRPHATRRNAQINPPIIILPKKQPYLRFSRILRKNDAELCPYNKILNSP